MKVAVLAGGRSSEHDVSLSSAVSVRAGVAAAGTPRSSGATVTIYLGSDSGGAATPTPSPTPTPTTG